MNIEVRKVELSERQNLGIFLEKSLPQKYRFPERWEWLYVHNPFIKKNKKIPVTIALFNSKIVGHNGSMQVAAKILDQKISAEWYIDFVVSPSFRGFKIGNKLIRAAQKETEHLSITLEGTEVSRGIRKKAGAVEGPIVKLYYRANRILCLELIKSISSKIENYTGIKKELAETILMYSGLIKVFGFLYGKYTKKRKNPVSIEKRQNLVLERVELFDNRANDLWSKVREQYSFAVERNSDYLNWKYVDQPYMKHQLFYVISDGSVIGVLVIRTGTPPEHNIGVISECYISEPVHDDNDVVKQIYLWVVKKAIKYLTELGAAGIYTASANPEFEKILENEGFKKVRQSILMMHFKEQNWDIADIIARPLIGIGDHDWDQYPNLRQPSLKQFFKMVKDRDF